jgi:hypothetical protein
MWGPSLKSFAGIVGGPNYFRNTIKKDRKVMHANKVKGYI